MNSLYNIAFKCWILPAVIYCLDCLSFILEYLFVSDLSLGRAGVITDNEFWQLEPCLHTSTDFPILLLIGQTWGSYQATGLLLVEREIWEVEIINTWMMILIFSNLQTHQYILSAKDIFRWRQETQRKQGNISQFKRLLGSLLKNLRTFKNR